MATEADRAILDSILEPLLPQQQPAEAVHDEGYVTSTESGDDSHLELIRGIELEGVSLAEKGEMEAAVSQFSRAIELAPDCPSPYNNRAQAYRLLGNVEFAEADLDAAVELSRKIGTKAKNVLIRALCQRGLLRRYNGNDEGAKSDFDSAAKLGSSFAKEQLVRMNPYAALCSQIVSQVMGRLRH